MYIYIYIYIYISIDREGAGGSGGAVAAGVPALEPGGGCCLNINRYIKQRT